MARQGIWQIPHSGLLWLVWPSKGGYEVSCPRQDIRNKEWITILVVALVYPDCFFPVSTKNTFGFGGLHKQSSLISPGRAVATAFWSISFPTDPGCVPHVQPTLKHQWILCTTRRPYQSLKKIDNIDKFTSLLTQKKAATKAPKQKLLRKRCFNPSARQTTCHALVWKNQPCPRKQKMQQPCSLLLRGQIQGSLWVAGRRPM